MRFRQRISRFALGMLVFAVVFCAAGEFASLAFALVDRLNGYARDLFVATDDRQCAYAMRPGVDVEVRRGPRTFRVRTNALGMREEPVAAPPAPGVHRVLVLGDSATFGEGLAAEEALPALLDVTTPDLRPQARLATVCAAERLDCLDLHPAFAATTERPLHFDTMRPDAAGHRVIARALADHLLAPPAGRPS